MKTFRALLSLVCVVLGIGAIAEATSDNTAFATQGILSVTTTFGMPGYTFQFSGAGFNVPSLVSDDFAGYSNFTVGGTIDEISKYPFLFYTVPFGTMVYNGHRYQWMGSITFTVGAFNYRFDKSGNLIVWGPANPSGSVTPCDLQNCESVTGPTIVFGGKWNYKATFYAIPDNPGVYGFSSLTVSTTPESSSLSLFASGLVIIGLITLWQHRRGTNPRNTLRSAR